MVETGDQELNKILIKKNIKWNYNIPQAHWLGGQFDRLIDMTTQWLFKSLGKTSLSWSK